MLLLKDIKGQSNPVRYLSRSLSSGRISASYLFSGPRGVGRALTAKAFLAEVLFSEEASAQGENRNIHEIEKIFKNEHPDIKWLVPEKNKSIGISEIREVKDILYMKPFSSVRNAAVIEDAHMMTQEAANALLKVLEEPPKNSLIILISDKKEMIPSTVLSRCSEVRFGAIPIEEAARIIKANSDADEKTAGVLARFCQGSVGRALESMKTGFAERQSMLSGIMENITCKGRDVFMNWYSEDKDTIIADIDAIIVMLRDAVLAREGIQSPLLYNDGPVKTEKWSIGEKTPMEVYRAMGRLVEIKNALIGNVNPKIVSQVLASAIGG